MKGKESKINNDDDDDDDDNGGDKRQKTTSGQLNRVNIEEVKKRINLSSMTMTAVQK